MDKNLNIKIPEELHVRLKTRAAQQKTTIREIITNLIKEFVIQEVE